jgi:hypothetical protein
MAVNYRGKKFYKIGNRSEPDVGASRTRMGLSRHVLDLIEKTGQSLRPEEEEEDSSEVEKNRKEKRESTLFFNNLKNISALADSAKRPLPHFTTFDNFLTAHPHPPFPVQRSYQGILTEGEG